MAVLRFAGIASRTIGKYFATAPALTDGDYEDLRLDSAGRVVVSPELVISQVTLHASAAKTATFNGADFTNEGRRGIKLFLDITVKAGTSPTLNIKLQAKDALSAKYFDLPGAAFAEKTTVTTAQLIVYPGVAETANESVSDVLPTTYRFVATIGGSAGQSFTFSLGAELLP